MIGVRSNRTFKRTGHLKKRNLKVTVLYTTGQNSGTVPLNVLLTTFSTTVLSTSSKVKLSTQSDLQIITKVHTSYRFFETSSCLFSKVYQTILHSF